LAGVLGGEHASAVTAPPAADQRPPPVFQSLWPVPARIAHCRGTRRRAWHGGPDRRPVAAWRAVRRGLRHRPGPPDRLRLPRPATGQDRRPRLIAPGASILPASRHPWVMSHLVALRRFC